MVGASLVPFRGRELTFHHVFIIKNMLKAWHHIFITTTLLAWSVKTSPGLFCFLQTVGNCPINQKRERERENYCIWSWEWSWVSGFISTVTARKRGYRPETCKCSRLAQVTGGLNWAVMFLILWWSCKIHHVPVGPPQLCQRRLQYDQCAGG